MDPSTLFLLLIIAAGIILLAVFFTFVPVMLWISALAAGVKISIFTLIGMRLRRVIPNRVVNPLIKAHKAGLDVTINQLESHYLAGGMLTGLSTRLSLPSVQTLNSHSPDVRPSI